MQNEHEQLRLSDYQDALYSQSACNLSGLIKSLAEITTRVWNTAHKLGMGTDWVNHHPIVQLFAYQAFWLSIGQSP
jgi:hypothetical protein